MAITIKDVRSSIPNADQFTDDQIYQMAGTAGITLAQPEQNSGFAGDTVTDLKRGALQLPGAAVGLGDAVLGLTGLDRPLDKATDWLGQKTGFQPGKTAELMQYDYSPERQASDAAINQAWADPNKSGLDVAGEYLANPRSTLGNIVQSLPAMLAGGLAGRYGVGLQKAAQSVKAGAMTELEFAKLAAKAAAVGEGSVMAGQAMQNIDESIDPQKAGLAALGIGALGGGIGYGSARAANALGLGDIQQIAASGGAAGVGNSTISPAKRIALGAIQEGPIEEGLQSVAETGLQNMAEDKPVGEGMARNVVEGALAGAVMGAGVNAFSRDNAQQNPDAGPLEKAANKAAPDKPLAPPELIFTADGQSLDKAELMRNFLANGVSRKDAVEYIRRIGAMPVEERTPYNLDPYRLMQARDAQTLKDGEALAERQAIQNEDNQGAEFDKSIPFENSRPTEKTPEPTWDEIDAYNAQQPDVKKTKTPIQAETVQQEAEPTQPIPAPESGVSPQVGGAGQVNEAPSFITTHINQAEPINASDTSGSIVTNDQRAAGENQGVGADQRGLATRAADVGRGDIDRGIGGNAGSVPGQTQQPSNSVDRGALSPILTQTKKGYLLNQLRQFKKDNPNAIRSAIDNFKSNSAAQYDEQLDNAFDGVPYETYANHPENKSVPESAKRAGWEALQTNKVANASKPTASTPTYGQKFNARSVSQQDNLNGKSTDTATQEAAAEEKVAFDNAAHQSATSQLNDTPQPTTSQIEAGNYKKGHAKFQGLEITIENPQGSTRSGIDPDGKAWSVEMKSHYGYIKRSKGADNEHVDVFVGPNHNSKSAFVVNQIDPKTKKFDEHKVMLGFTSKEEAEKGYRENYADGWDGLNSIVQIPVKSLQKMIDSGELKKPVKGKTVGEKSKTNQTQPIPPNAAANSDGNEAQAGSGAERSDVLGEEKVIKKPPTVSNNAEGLQKPGTPVTDIAKQAEPATTSNQKQSGDSVADNERGDSTKELEDLFKSLGKQGLRKNAEAKLEGHPQAALIRNVQNNWLDVLMDHGFEQDKPNGLKGKLSQSILMNGC